MSEVKLINIADVAIEEVKWIWYPYIPFDNSIDVLTNHKAISVHKAGQNKIVIVQDITTGEIKSIECEEIFISSGIRSNADILKVEKTGVETDSKS